jgi:DNA-binding MarR family transcriptional regulator
MLTMYDPYDLHTGIGYQLTIAARTNNAQFEKKLSKLGLTRQMWCVLIAVGEQRISTPSAIADYIGIIRPAASRTLKQMDRAGLLYRTTDDTDKRSTTVALTSKGHDLLQRSLPLAFQARKHTNRVLSKTEQIQITTLLEKLTGSMQAKAKGV